MDTIKYGSELRKHQRLPISLPLEYRRMQDSCPRTGLTLNLSKAGLLFYCRGEMGVGTLLTITIMFADEYELTSLEVCAKIAWKDLYFEKDWSEYKYGAEFIYLTEDDQEKLDGLLSAYVLEENSIVESSTDGSSLMPKIGSSTTGMVVGLQELIQG